MVKLVPLKEEQFAKFKEHAIRNYAEQSVLAGRVSRDNALEYSEKEFVRALPDGLATKDAIVFAIVESGGAVEIGHVWLGRVPVQGSNLAFIFDLLIFEQHRGRGLGYQTLVALEAHLKTLGYSGMSLHVFASNKKALGLYERFGFQATDLVMSKMFS